MKGGGGFILVGGIGDAHRRGVPGTPINQPQPGRAFVGRTVGLGHLIRDPAAIGRRSWRGDALERRQIDLGHRPGKGGGGQGGGERKRAGQDMVSHESGLAGRRAGSSAFVVCGFEAAPTR